MNIKVGDIVFMELGAITGKASFTRLVQVEVVTVSFDGARAVVKVLPPPADKKDVIHDERVWAGHCVIRDTTVMYLNKQDYEKRNSPFKVGDIVEIHTSLVLSQTDDRIGTVIKVGKTYIDVIHPNGHQGHYACGSLIVVSRPNHQETPGDTAKLNNGNLLPQHYRVS